MSMGTTTATASHMWLKFYLGFVMINNTDGGRVLRIREVTAYFTLGFCYGFQRYVIFLESDTSAPSIRI